MADDDRDPRDPTPAPSRNVGPEEEVSTQGGSVTFDSAGRVQGASLNIGQDQPLQYAREHDPSSATHDGVAAAANQTALDSLQQALDNLGNASNSDDIVRQLTSVYAMANNVLHGESWDAGFAAEFEAWLPYEVSSGASTEYLHARDTVHQAGAAVHAAAAQWVTANPNRRLTGAMEPRLAQPLQGIGTALRAAIDAAHAQIQQANASGLTLMHQAVADLAGASDADTIVRDASTIFSMANNLLHGQQWEPALAQETQAWISVTATDAATAARDPLVTAAQTFAASADQMAQWYPCHALLGWAEAPVQDLLTAGATARAAIAGH